ncbi:type IV pilus modification protein PilV [Lentisalinibacter sediminis]|uniref:type IV pilus modification protein PilV n=1 Tax=Lentisalinibacter sediminis TaxID=2992237 RepID=UPI0038644039
MSEKMNANLMQRIRGFTLIEALIAMVVMSVGMLGIAGLYLQTLQAGRTSQFRTQAVTLAGDVADRIRANRTAGIAYAGAGADNDCDTGLVDCDADQMAQHDIFLWSQQAQQTLPGGDVEVALDQLTVPWTYTVTVNWDEAGQPEAPSYTIQVQAMN